MTDYLIDTNIFIAILKGDAKLKSLVESMACAIDTIVYVELIQARKTNRKFKK